MNNKIAVVLVTFNRADMLRKNLDSLKNQGKLTYFIVDNNSTDHTREVIFNFKSSIPDKVYYFNTHANLGGAGGFALGCEKALNSKEKFTHLWLTDDDITFSKDCLKNLMPYMDQTTILQPMRYASDGSNAEVSSTIIDLDRVFILNHKRNTVKGSKLEKVNYPFELQSIPFEGPLVPRTIFEKVGVPDKRYFIFSDDLDFSLKAIRNGFMIKCIPSARIVRLRNLESNYIPKDWKSYFLYRNFFRIEREFGNNCIVRNRPFFLAILVAFYCLLTLNFIGVKIIKDALFDGVNKRFPIDEKYIP